MPRLSKSRFVAGLQCHRLLWWKTHQPDAPELVVLPGRQAIFDNGHRVGAAARAFLPGGALVELDPRNPGPAIDRTAELLQAGVDRIYEASFRENGVFVAVDILDRVHEGEDAHFVLMEVKSATSVKPHYIPDLAVQLHVLREAGLDVRRTELLHLNPAHRHPDTEPLFVRADVTDRVEAFLPEVPGHLEAMQAMLAGTLPNVTPGEQCRKPYPCDFQARCWPRVREPDLADARAVIKPGLAAVLEAIEGPLAYLDFETIGPALPVWAGTRPYPGTPVQFSVHRPRPDPPEQLDHHAFLADGSGDPRPALAAALVPALEGARSILAWSATFERRCLLDLAAAVPGHAAALKAAADRLVDLLPITRKHVQHPGFRGSYSLKSVLPALLPGRGYDDLEVADGNTATRLLETLLLRPHELPPNIDPDGLRQDLLRYCERDTLALVEIHRKLRELAASP